MRSIFQLDSSLGQPLSTYLPSSAGYRRPNTSNPVPLSLSTSFDGHLEPIVLSPGGGPGTPGSSLSLAEFEPTPLQIETFIDKNKERLHRCAKCRIYFPSREHLQAHATAHIFDEKVRCLHCSEFFDTDELYAAHKTFHVPQSVHICPNCRGRFVNRLAVKKHVRRCTHRVEEPTNQWSRVIGRPTSPGLTPNHAGATLTSFPSIASLPETLPSTMATPTSAGGLLLPAVNRGLMSLSPASSRFHLGGSMFSGDPTDVPGNFLESEDPSPEGESSGAGGQSADPDNGGGDNGSRKVASGGGSPEAGDTGNGGKSTDSGGQLLLSLDAEFQNVPVPLASLPAGGSSDDFLLNTPLRHGGEMGDASSTNIHVSDAIRGPNESAMGTAYPVELHQYTSCPDRALACDDPVPAKTSEA